MKSKFTDITLFFYASLIVTLIAACGPAVLPATQTTLPASTPSPLAVLTDTPCDGLCPSDSMTATAAMGLTMTANPGNTPVCEGLCPGDSMTATAAMGLTFAAIPTNTPPPGATIIPSVGDLGWGAVYGQIVDGVTGRPIQGAIVKCEHPSYTSPYLCKGSTTTDSNGAYIFRNVFFHDTDRIILTVEAPGYAPLHFEQDSFTRPEFNANLGLFPVDYQTAPPTPVLMCTAPACEGGSLVCGSSGGCPGGCGTICLPFTPTPILMCTPPACQGGTLVCGNSNGCPGGCGTICLPLTPTP